MTFRPPVLRPLTAFRIIAAVPVLIAHFTSTLGPCPVAPATVEQYRHEAIAGVSFFFVLSGFILAYNYREKLAEPTWTGTWNFLTLRWARIYPVYFLSLLLSFPGSTLKWLAALFLVQSFVPHQTWYHAFNPVAWSLSSEWFCYLAFPLALPLLARFEKRKGRFVLAGALCAVCLALTLTLTTAPPWGFWLRYIFPPVRLLEFGAGILLGLNFATCTAAPRWASLREFAAAGLLAGLVLVAPFSGISATGRLLGYYTPAVALVILAFAPQAGWLSRRVSGPVWAYLGEISFALYMLHFPLLYQFHSRSWLAFAREWPPEAQWLVMLAVSFGAAAAVHRWLEVPARRWLVGRLQRREAPAAPASVEASRTGRAWAA